MAVKWKWNNNTGGSVPANLEQRIQVVETKASTNETNITTLRTDLNNKIQKRVVDATIGVGTTYVIQASSGYEIVNVMVGRKRTSDSFYFFTHPTVNLNFQFFAKTDGSYNIYTEGGANGFNNEYKIYLVEKKI